MTEQRTVTRRGRPRKTDRDLGDGKSIVVALDRGLRALIFLADSGGATLTEISLNTNTPVATTHRILATLRQRGMAQYDDATGKWTIGPQAYRVGATYRESHNLLEVALPVLQAISKETGETSNLAIEDNGELVYLIQVESENPIRASMKNGAANHLNTSGVGKVILAYMPKSRLHHILQSTHLARQTPNSITERTDFIAELARIRQQGWGLDNEERFAGMRCVAAPVFDPAGSIIAGVSISGPSARFPDEALKDLSQCVIRAAQEITDGLSPSSI